MPERTNEQWLADLRSEGSTRAEALSDLRERLERGLFYYLSHDRSDLSDRSSEEIQQMAQDFAQDALLKVIDNLDTFRGESMFVTWASKIAARVAISELRRARYRDYSLDYLTAEGEVMPSITSLAISPEDSPQPEDVTERADVLSQIDDALEHALTDRQRSALMAVAVEGIPIEEVAERMNTNRNALYKLLHDARMKLKHYMEDQGLTLDYIIDLFESG
jgi:RNA polymerase sigma-70 factor (ECF subfamily)